MLCTYLVMLGWDAMPHTAEGANIDCIIMVTIQTSAVMRWASVVIVRCGHLSTHMYVPLLPLRKIRRGMHYCLPSSSIGSVEVMYLPMLYVVVQNGNSEAFHYILLEAIGILLRNTVINIYTIVIPIARMHSVNALPSPLVGV